MKGVRRPRWDRFSWPWTVGASSRNRRWQRCAIERESESRWKFLIGFSPRFASTSSPIIGRGRRRESDEMETSCARVMTFWGACWQQCTASSRRPWTNNCFLLSGRESGITKTKTARRHQYTQRYWLIRRSAAETIRSLWNSDWFAELARFWNSTGSISRPSGVVPGFPSIFSLGHVAHKRRNLSLSNFSMENIHLFDILLFYYFFSFFPICLYVSVRRRRHRKTGKEWLLKVTQEQQQQKWQEREERPKFLFTLREGSKKDSVGRILKMS